MLLPSPGSNTGTWVSNRRNQAGFKLCESKNYFSFTGVFEIKRNCDTRDSHTFLLCVEGATRSRKSFLLWTQLWSPLQHAKSSPISCRVAEFPYNIHPAVEVQCGSSFQVCIYVYKFGYHPCTGHLCSLSTDQKLGFTLAAFPGHSSEDLRLAEEAPPLLPTLKSLLLRPPPRRSNLPESRLTRLHNANTTRRPTRRTPRDAGASLEQKPSRLHTSTVTALGLLLLLPQLPFSIRIYPPTAARARCCCSGHA